MNKNDIIATDWQLLKEIYKDNIAEAEKKLKENYPIQYLIGYVDFYNTKIIVNEDVLIPRFETEFLVAKTLKYLKKLGKSKLNILEIGTGSGCISIALAKHLNCHITAIDISPKAISLAQKNAKSNNATIDFQNIAIENYSSLGKYDLVISNPPYVKFHSKVDKKTKYEPQNAIFAPDNGLYFYKKIIDKIKNNLNDNYLIAFEIDNNEGDSVKKIIKKDLVNAYVVVEKDLNNLERYVFVSNNNLFNIE